jgi:hypothetical protein
MTANIRSVDPRPRPTFAIGITGHRNIGVEGPVANAVAAALDDIVAQLTHAVAEATARGPQFFSGANPTLRLVGMAADGADLLAARAARAHSCEIACVLPFPIEECRKDFETPAAREFFDSILSRAASIFVLPGARADGARAYERANGIIRPRMPPARRRRCRPVPVVEPALMPAPLAAVSYVEHDKSANRRLHNDRRDRDVRKRQHHDR